MSRYRSNIHAIEYHTNSSDDETIAVMLNVLGQHKLNKFCIIRSSQFHLLPPFGELQCHTCYKIAYLHFPCTNNYNIAWKQV
jgi:hypothetical protein